MYEKTYGPKYDEKLSTTEIAARVRADIKAAVIAGELPRAIYSVRKFHHNAIHVTVSDVPFVILNREHVRNDLRNVYAGPSVPWLSPRAAALSKALERMLDAYNFDGSDIQSDYFNVNYYGHVTFDGTETTAEREMMEAMEKVSGKAA